MELLRKLRFVLYPTVFFAVFLMAAYCTFPKSVLRDIADSSLTRAAIQIGPKTRGMPQISFKDVSLWRMSGMSIIGLSIMWPEKKSEPPIVLQLDALKGRIGMFSLISSSKSFSAHAKLYEGNIDLSGNLRAKNSLGFIDIEALKLNLAKMAFFESTLGAPMQGVVQLLLKIHANTEFSKDGAGSAKFTIDNFGYGPGSLKLPTGTMVSSITVPQVNLGKLMAEFSMEKGQLESKTISLTGGDVEADIKLSVTIGRRPTSSRISGSGWFSIKREFVNANETLKMLYDLVPELRAALQGDGKVGIVIRGNLERPDFGLERYVGAKIDDKSGDVDTRKDS